MTTRGDLNKVTLARIARTAHLTMWVCVCVCVAQHASSILSIIWCLSRCTWTNARNVQLIDLMTGSLLTPKTVVDVTPYSFHLRFDLSEFGWTMDQSRCCSVQVMQRKCDEGNSIWLNEEISKDLIMANKRLMCLASAVAAFNKIHSPLLSLSFTITKEMNILAVWYMIPTNYHEYKWCLRLKLMYMPELKLKCTSSS